MKGFNHYCAKHEIWWHTSKHKDCPKCIKEKHIRKKNELRKKST